MTMGLLGKRNRHRHIEGLKDLGLDDPLAAVPVVEENVEARVDNLRLVQLERRIRPTGTLRKRMATWLNQKYRVRFNLDECGTHFWNGIDGRATLGELADSLGERFGFDSHKARQAVMLFARALLKRRLVYLTLPSGQRIQADGE
jgi:hypothetical protein